MVRCKFSQREEGVLLTPFMQSMEMILEVTGSRNVSYINIGTLLVTVA